ncbi:MAG: hypothetical protein HDS42_05335 [Bacteroides sp.]|nr:hypothetical protein [Bacteroides sp.]
MDPIQLTHLKNIQIASQTDRLVLFVGAGISANSGVPTWKQLIDEMKKELPDSISYETDDLKVAQAYKDMRGEKEYLDKVKEVLRHNKVIPNPIHEAIFNLNPVHILTTNYDDLLEQELETEFKQYDIIREDLDLPNMIYSSALVKMHGDFLKNNIVLTETDYYNYSKNFPLIRSFVQSIFATKLVVFIGFSFNDLNLKMILNEVKNILGERMQRAYLISLNEPDALTIKYFEKRHINIVYLREEGLSALLNSSIQSSLEKSKISKLSTFGRKLYDYLRIIKEVDFFNASNPISYVWNKISPFQDEMRVYGRGLKYFLPKNMGDFYWHEHSHGVQTFHGFFKSLFTQLKSRRSRYEFIMSIGRENVKPLLKLAYYNSLDSIDHVEFLNQKFYNGIELYDIESGMANINMFDFNGLAKRLKDLSHKVISGEITDLETGYIYYKLKDYHRAYIEFNRVLPIAWRKGKYVLYFLCLYNLYKLRYAVKLQLGLSKTIDGEAISEKLCRINPSEALSKLQLPVEFKKIFQDLLADRYLNEHLVESEKLKEELHRQRISAENGASSMNSNIALLLGIQRREEKFCDDNFILSDFNTNSTALNRNVVIGILNSHATKDHQESPWSFGNTKLETLDGRMINILTSALPFSELEKIFKQYKIQSLSLDEKGSKYIKKCIENLKDESFSLFWCDMVRERIMNLLYIISFVKVSDIDIEAIYSLVLWLLDVPVVVMNMNKFVPGIIKYNTPTTEVAVSLLKKILSFDSIEHSHHKTIKALCEVIAKSDVKLDLLDEIRDKKLSEDMIQHLAFIIPDDKKDAFYQWAIPKIKKQFIQYVIFLHIHKLLPDDLEEFRLSLMSYTDEFQMNYGSVGSIMAKWRNNSKYSEVWDIIDDCAEEHPYLKFALNPLEYDDKENVHAEWIKALGEDKVREIIKNSTYNNILLKHIAFGNFTPEDRLDLLSVYKDDNTVIEG